MIASRTGAPSHDSARGIGQARDVIARSTQLPVDAIHSQRGQNEPELRHDHFMAKVPLVLGEGVLKFRGIYLDSMNREKPCYIFPKREACLMAMSYSYDYAFHRRPAVADNSGSL